MQRPEALAWILDPEAQAMLAPGTQAGAFPHHPYHFLFPKLQGCHSVPLINVTCSCVFWEQGAGKLTRRSFHRGSRLHPFLWVIPAQASKLF